MLLFAQPQTSTKEVAKSSMPGIKVFPNPANNNVNFRNGTTANGGPLGMDSLTYKYQHGNNKLDHVNDAVASTNYSVDIDNEDTLNYRYDEIGNLTKDSAAGIDSIYWTVYGKIWKIVKFNGDTIKFRYGPDGNRIAKEVFKDTLHTWTNTYYVHDATGNIMATYQWKNKDTFNLDELMMYGSSGLGTVGINQYLNDTITRDSAWYAANPTYSNPNTDSVVYYSDGLKQYELTNHLGNVLLTLTDRHIPVYIFGNFALYKPEVASAQDYYPFGMIMPGRSFTSTNYRYGFNNKEKDDEVAGNGNTLDFGSRIYSNRLGKWLSVDAYHQLYPSISPYGYTMDNPIILVDVGGKYVKIGAAGSTPWEDLTTLINIAFDKQVVATTVPDGHGGANLYVDLAKGVKENQLTKEQSEAYKDIRKMCKITSATYTINVDYADAIYSDLYDPQDRPHDPGMYIYPNNWNQFSVNSIWLSKLYILYHFFKETEARGNLASNYDRDHNAALDAGLKVFGFKHVNGMVNKDRTLVDVDIVDGLNKYQTTARMDASDPQHIKISYYQRAGVQKGDVIRTDLWKKQEGEYDEQFRKRINQHFKDNPANK